MSYRLVFCATVHVQVPDWCSILVVHSRIMPQAVVEGDNDIDLTVLGWKSLHRSLRLVMTQFWCASLWRNAIRQPSQAEYPLVIMSDLL